MAWVFYKNFKLGQLGDDGAHGEYPVDFDTDVIGLMLLDGGSTIDQNDVDVADIIAGASDSEVTGTNYARKAVTSIAVAASGNNADVNTTMSDISYAQSASGFSDAEYAILYKANSSIGSETDASCPVIAYNTFSSSIGNVAGALTLQFSSSNIFTLS